MANRVNELSANDWDAIEEIEKAWLTFANRIEQYQLIHLGNVNTKDLAYFYIELRKQLYDIKN
ncbi:hypothetical protein DS745_02445 [Anaerobacillus alkaliphilus]|uniref:Uncharacterized protein n=1 Tax=Anaerobacillus alkaliphilus TaxID=1548597 RepID=A0A4Q0VX07_9BACI|nr:hypothetical protein [Anaerobacillus alkaliphilus]RXJ04263.1 hypothetical protein DS745_02445 [Anaerobacillus alkaliphilus]